ESTPARRAALARRRGSLYLQRGKFALEQHRSRLVATLFSRAGQIRMPTIDHQPLLNFCERLLSAGGVPAGDAALVAELLVKAELRGYAGHGVARVGQYLGFIHNKVYDLS